MNEPRFIILWHAPSDRYVICERIAQRDGARPIYKMLSNLCYEFEQDAQRGLKEKEGEK